MGALDQVLLAHGVLSANDLDHARRQSDGDGERLLEHIRGLAHVDERALLRALSAYYAVPLVTDADWPQSPLFADTLAPQFLRERAVLPLRVEGGVLVLAVADPGDEATVRAIRLATGLPTELRIASVDDIRAALRRAATEDIIAAETVATASTSAGDGDDDVEQLKDLALGAPVVQFVNQLLADALHTRATDIHIEPNRTRLAVRLRIDGMLREVRSPPLTMARAIASRVKILANLDIAQRRLPQDGRARIKLEGRQLELRVATQPTVNGESIAIRILENTQRALELSKLGFSERDEAMLRRHLSAPYGLILVTGPTGSGKTTTLATALTILNEPLRKILTIEDPVEYQIDGINQTQIQPEIGITFAHALRSFLRHDPDVIMVGELRDTETARTAVQAALTGHLVLSTLHTNSAAGAVTRLLDMGVDGYLLASCLRCIVGQRLVPRICTDCAEEIAATPELLAAFDLPPDSELPGLMHGRGCRTCRNKGKKGRVAIHEVLYVTPEIQSLISASAPRGELLTAARAAGYRPLLFDGLDKAMQGLITLEDAVAAARAE